MARLTAKWLEGEALMRLNRGTEAAEIIEASLRDVERIAPDSKLHADLLRSRASNSAYRGEYGDALAAYTDAHQRYEALGDDRSGAIVLQNIGSLYADARDYERALGYYEQASAAFPEDKALTLSAKNNLGNAFKELGRYDDAESAFNEAFEIASSMESPLLEARILTNIASTLYLKGELDNAEATLMRGLGLVDAGAEQWAPFLYGVRAQIAVDRGNFKLAERYIARTFDGLDLATTPSYFRDFHETAFNALSALGMYERANAHLLAFNRLEGQARDLSAKANNALLAARFDAANRELRISRLSAEKAANAVRLTKAQNQVYLLSAGIAFAIIAFLGALFTLRTVARSRRAIAAANDRLVYVSQHDGLTDLYAREHFRTLLEKYQACATEAGQQGVLMLIDLDRFKQVNDIYGHVVGDHLLANVAKRFRASTGDAAIIGRLGGDEFGVILPPPSTIAEGEAIAKRLIEEVSAPYRIEGHDMTIGASVGITAFGESGATTSSLLTNADLSLYEAKARGRGTHVTFEPRMRRELEERSNLEADLEAALQNGELDISYQPIVSSDGRKVVYYEALMRWNHPIRGPIMPSVFIPIAENALLIEQLGCWMLRSACEAATTWPKDVKLTVNVSSLQLHNNAFLGTVVDALAQSGLEPHRLILELTESVVLEMDEQLEALLASLNKIGVTFALDDFGRGYSSLNYIEKMNFSMIKIDRDFVQSAAAGSPKSEAIITAIVSLAEALGIAVTAEGIEREEQMMAMSALGCTSFQGYHFGRPAPLLKAALSESRTASGKAA